VRARHVRPQPGSRSQLWQADPRPAGHPRSNPLAVPGLQPRGLFQVEVARRAGRPERSEAISSPARVGPGSGPPWRCGPSSWRDTRQPPACHSAWTAARR
jgi:hypothetical protein